MREHNEHNIEDRNSGEMTDQLKDEIPGDVVCEIPDPKCLEADETSEIIQKANAESLKAIYKSLKNGLVNEVPDNLQIEGQDEPTEEEVNNIIDSANSSAISAMDNARLAVLRSYAQNEKERTDRQKPLLYAIVGLTIVQLLVFNLIIGLIAWWTYKNGETSVVLQFFDILKYYIGATVVELIGMIWFITRGTFSSDHIKMMELMFGDEKMSTQDKTIKKK